MKNEINFNTLSREAQADILESITAEDLLNQTPAEEMTPQERASLNITKCLRVLK